MPQTSQPHQASRAHTGSYRLTQTLTGSHSLPQAPTSSLRLPQALTISHRLTQPEMRALPLSESLALMFIKLPGWHLLRVCYLPQDWRDMNSTSDFHTEMTSWERWNLKGPGCPKGSDAACDGGCEGGWASWPPVAGVALLQPRVIPADIITFPPGAKGTTLQPHDPR